MPQSQEMIDLIWLDGTVKQVKLQMLGLLDNCLIRLYLLTDIIYRKK